MAGIGFELKKLYSKRGLFAMFRAVGYSTAVCVGPMLLGIVLLLGIMYICVFFCRSAFERELLVCMTTYSLLASLLVTSIFSMIITRFLADMLYTQHREAVLPSFFGINAMTLVRLSTRIETVHVVIGVVGILILMELCRRCVGVPILCVAGVLIVYAFINQLSYAGAVNGATLYDALKTIIYKLFYTTSGVIGTPINVCYKFIVLFIIFGAFLERTGIGDYFVQLANAVVGRFSGGPAKVAVVASALEGMCSGSSVANTVGSGSVTIPMMKKTGYKPHFAGAVEAVASTGGQIMPPVMGSGAFIMAELIGYKYSQIALGALLPAILYYLSILLMVDFEAAKSGLLGVDTSHMDAAKKILKQGWNLLVPLIILIVCLAFFQFTVARSATLAILATIIACALKKETRMNFKTILDGFETGVLRSVSVICAVASAGVAIGCIMLTGVGAKFAFAVLTLAHNNLFLTLLMSGLAATILGMGLPTVAAYIISASLLASSLVQLGIPIFAAHMFLLYYSILSQITPPVALAAYAGAAIAQANPMKTAIQATKLAIGAFIVPYAFALSPSMLLIDTTAMEVILITITSLIGIASVSAAMEGYIMGNLNWFQRVLMLVGGLMMIYPGATTDAIGIALSGAVVVLKLVQNKKMKAQLA